MEYILDDITIEYISCFPNSRHEVSFYDLTAPLHITESVKKGVYDIIPKIWIISREFSQVYPYKSDYVIVKQEDLLAKNLDPIDFVEGGFAQEATLEEVNTLMQEAHTKGYLMALDAKIKRKYGIAQECKRNILKLVSLNFSDD